mgnify:FL=1
MTITLDSKAEDIASTLELDDSELEAELALELKSLTSTLEMTRLDVVEKPLPEEPEAMDFHPPQADAPAAAPASGADEGWRIARQAMVRDFLVLSGKGFAGFVVLAVVGFSVLWGFDKVRQVNPQTVKSSLAKIFPVLNGLNNSPSNSEPVVSIPQETPAPTEKVRTASRSRSRNSLKERRNARRNQSRVKVARRYSPYSYWSADHPNGGSITYSDGTITEYTWH